MVTGEIGAVGLPVQKPVTEVSVLAPDHATIPPHSTEDWHVQGKVQKVFLATSYLAEQASIII
jgi:hypothetical protein